MLEKVLPGQTFIGYKARYIASFSYFNHLSFQELPSCVDSTRDSVPDLDAQDVDNTLCECIPSLRARHQTYLMAEYNCAELCHN